MDYGEDPVYILHKMQGGTKMNLIINIVAIGFIIYGLITVKKNEINLKDYIKSNFNKYTKVDVIVGILIGFIAMAAIFFIELKLNCFEIKNINSISDNFIITLLTLAVLALGEELLFRGFMLNGLIRLLKNKYIAVIITAVLFGLAHAGNPNATTISIISNGLGGVMYAVAFIESDSIWLAFALHFAWNFFQGPVFGFPVSGMNFGGIVEQSFEAGPNIISGGSYGPEGGIVGISFRIVIIAMLLLYYFVSIKKRKNA